MVFRRLEFALKVLNLLPTQWVYGFGAYEALEFLDVDDYISITYKHLDKTQLEKIIKLCIESVNPQIIKRRGGYLDGTPYAVLEAINREKDKLDKIAHQVKNSEGVNHSKVQLTLDKGKFTGEMYALTRSDKCKDPEYILTMYCDKPAKRIQKVWRRWQYQQNKSARIIQAMVTKWLYKPGGAMMKKAETRFYKMTGKA